MNLFYPTRLLKKSFFFAAALCATSFVEAQVYYGTLLGANEFPANTSPGTGKTLVTIDAAAKTMKVEVVFTGLVTQTTAGAPSGTTASHIHASATLTPFSLTSTAGVATQTPSFTGFPTGVQGGAYVNTFNMTQNSSYNGSYITGNGGTAEAAFAALQKQIAEGRSYLNIHSTAYTGGEIRGYLIPCPAINISIPDAWALPSGTLANTVYPAYAPAASLTLQASASGGSAPYTYSWSNGATSSATKVSPTATTTYTLKVTDNNGCPGTATKTVKMMDIADGKKGDKILVCHNEKNSLSIATAAVVAHLQHGDMLGSCEANSNTKRMSTETAPNNLAVKLISGNPTRNGFDLQISSPTNKLVRINVYDHMGRLIESKSQPANQTLRLGNGYRPGTYLVQFIQGLQKQTVRLQKTN